MILNIRVSRNGKTYKAVCPELGISAAGTTKSGARSRLEAIIDFYIKIASKRGIDIGSYNVVEELEYHNYNPGRERNTFFNSGNSAYLN